MLTSIARYIAKSIMVVSLRSPPSGKKINRFPSLNSDNCPLYWTRVSPPISNEMNYIRKLYFIWALNNTRMGQIWSLGQFWFQWIFIPSISPPPTSCIVSIPKHCPREKSREKHWIFENTLPLSLPLYLICEVWLQWFFDACIHVM